MINASRSAHLDGLRGIASLMVLFNHLALSVLPSISNLQPDASGVTALIAIGRSPLSAAWGGDFGVCIFFVLSGYVLSQFAHSSNLRVYSMVVRRYVRLALPMVAATLLGYLLLKLDLYRNVAAATAVSHSGWAAMWYGFSPSLATAIYEGAVGAFISGRSDYNCNLWTMQIELIGSVAIFILYAVPMPRSWRAAIAVASVAFLPGYYPVFAVGVALFELHSLGAPMVARLGSRTRAPIIAVVFIVAILAGAFPASGQHTAIVSPWHRWLSNSDNAQGWHMLGASLLMIAVLHSSSLKKALASRAGQFIGRLSFPIYLVQIPLLCSLTAWLMLAMASAPYLLMAGVTALATIVAAFGVADLMWRFVEQPSLSLSRQVGYFLNNVRGYDKSPAE